MGGRVDNLADWFHRYKQNPQISSVNTSNQMLEEREGKENR